MARLHAVNTSRENTSASEVVAQATAATAAGEADRQIAAAVSEALQKPSPVFNTHSAALAGEIAAKAESYKAMVAEIDAKLNLLEAERTDLMLAYSMLSHAMSARETTAA